MNRVILSLALAVVSVLLILVASLHLATEGIHTVPTCPQEDSCTIDYRNHGWYVNDQRVTK